MRRRSSPFLGLGIALAFLVPTHAQGRRESPAPARWDTLVADVTVRHRRLDRHGQPMGLDPPPVRYRWERSQGPSGWKTVIAFADRGGSPAGRPQDARVTVGRVEDDGDGTPVRVYNRRGERLALPPIEKLGLERATHLLPTIPESTTGAGRLSARDGAAATHLVAPADETPARRRKLTDRFGRQAGRIRGLQRFVRTEGDHTEELLADPESALPVEMNVVREGRLVWHGRFAYVRDRRGAYVQRTIHVEEAVGDDEGRMATDLELENVRLEQRRVR